MKSSVRLSRRTFLQATAGLSVGLGLAACTAGVQPAAESAEPAAEQTEILVWDQFGENSAGVDDLVAEFNEANPDIRVTREAQQNMRDILRTSLDAGAGPDIMYYDTGPGFAGVLARAGLLLSLEDAYAQYNWDERILPIAKDRATFDSTPYGIGNELEIVGTFYNQRIFEEQGLTVATTHDEFLSLCATLQSNGIIPIAFGNQNKWPAGHTFSVYSGNTAGQEMLAQAISGEVSWTEEEFVNAIQIPFVDMVEAGYYNSDVNAVTYDDSNLLFYSGQAAIRLTGSWMIDNFTSPDTMPDPVGFFFYPSVQGQTIAPPAGLGSGYFVAHDTEVPEAAFQFLNFLFSEGAVESWLEGMSMIPPVRLNVDEYNISDLLSFTITAIQESADSMGYNIDVLTPDTFNTMMFDGFQEVIGGVKTAEQQAEDLEATMQEALEQGTVMDITD